MTTSPPPVGSRLRAARLAQRLSLEDVASRSGVTKGFLSRLERDRATASVAALVRVCDALGLAVGSLFADGGPGAVVRADAYPPITFGGSGMREFLLTPRGERRLQAILSVVEPGGGSGAEPYTLTPDVELAFVVEGTVRVDVDGDPVELSAGDALTFDPGRPHCFEAVGESPARVLWVLSPGLGETERRSPA